MRGDAIDWQQPWLLPLRAVGAPIEAAVRGGASVAMACQAAVFGRGANPYAAPPSSVDAAAAVREPVALPPPALPQFVPASDLPEGQAYEAFIARSGCLPTRDNRHDFFNALMWLHRPALKRRLNILQASEIDRYGIQRQRGPVRDALTLFDENGAVLHAPSPLVEALRRRDWHGLFVTQRALWADANLALFGHALLEKLCQPRKALTAHVLVCGPLDPPDPRDPQAADPLLMSADDWAAKPFLPLPVLGVPGWWPANEAPGFYDDAAVFRLLPDASFAR